MSLRNLFGGSKCRTVDVCDIFGDSSGVALYRLDGNANDESGNYHGTETAITYGGGVYERGAVFNGTSSQIVIPNIAVSLKSISFYGRKVASATQMVIYGGADESWFGFGATDNVMRMAVNGGIGFDLTMLSNAVVGTTYHFVLTWETSTSLKLYRDGILQSTTAVGGYQTTAITYIGRRNSALWMNGMLDQVRIFNRAITATEVATLYAECAPTSIVDNANPFEDNSLKAMYQFNGNANDLTGVYNGTATNVTYGTGKFGQCAVFNGTSARVTATATTLTNVFTYSVWVNPTTVASQVDARSITDNATTRAVLSASGVNSTTVKFYDNTAWRDFAYTLTVSVWTHLAVVVNGTNVKLYVNGEMKSSLTCASVTPSGTMYIGTNNAQNGNWYSGNLEQFRIFNKALTPMEVASLYTEITPMEEPLATLVDPFKDGSGKALYRLEGNALDESGNYNGTATSVTYGNGISGRCGVFNGSTSNVATSLVHGQQVSFSVWASSTNVTLDRDIFGSNNGTSDAGGMTIQTMGSKPRMIFSGASNWVYTSQTNTSSLTNNTLYHFVLTFNGSVGKLYLNGVLIETTGAIAMKTPTVGCKVGFAGNGYWSGNIDQPRVFDRELTLAEIQTLYTKGA
jgi:hypothetical protein